MVSMTGTGHQELMELVAKALQAVNLYTCYKMHKKRKDDPGEYADLFSHMLLGRVCHLRLHDETGSRQV